MLAWTADKQTKTNKHTNFLLSFTFHSEFGGGPCCVAPLLTAAALLGAPAQLHGAPLWGRGRHQHGAADFTQLWGEPAEAMLLVGHCLLLHHLPPVRHLLEHLCIWAAGGADTSSSLMKTPHQTLSSRPSSTYTLTPTQPWKDFSSTIVNFPIPSQVRPKWNDMKSFKTKVDQYSFFTDTLQIKEIRLFY